LTLPSIFDIYQGTKKNTFGKYQLRFGEVVHTEIEYEHVRMTECV